MGRSTHFRVTDSSLFTYPTLRMANQYKGQGSDRKTGNSDRQDSSRGSQQSDDGRSTQQSQSDDDTNMNRERNDKM